MAKRNLKKISAFLPSDLIQKAIRLSDLNQTDTIVAALNELIDKHKRVAALKSLKKFHFDYDVDEVRQRRQLL